MATPGQLFWALPATRAEVELLQERLKNIAAGLGAIEPAAAEERLQRLLDSTHEVSSRICKILLDVEEASGGL